MASASKRVTGGTFIRAAMADITMNATSIATMMVRKRRSSASDGLQGSSKEW